MNKIKQLSFVLFIFSALVFSYPVTQVFAQGGGQCDSNPACNPASGTCCGQCDSNPACNPNDPNGIPCCSSGSNNMSSGTLPPRIPAPSGHNKMNHENRRPSDKSDLLEGEELRDAFKGCLEKLDIQDTLLQERAQQPQCRGVSQANRDQNTIRELRSDTEQLRAGLQSICYQLSTVAYGTGGIGEDGHVPQGGGERGARVRYAHALLNSVCTPLSETIGTFRFHHLNQLNR